MMSYYAIGCYTHKVPNALLANGEGISTLRLNEDLGLLEVINTFSNVKNPTYLCYIDKSDTLLSISEDEDYPVGEVLSLKYKSYALELLSRTQNEGHASCHIINSEDRVFTASYANGSIAEYELKDNKPVLISNHNYIGSGPNKERQESPHAHQGTIISGNLYVCDLGTDTIWKHTLNSELSCCNQALKVPSGYGPRHMAVDQDGRHLFILCELVPRILVVSINEMGDLELIEDLPSTDPNIDSISAPAAIKIHPSGLSLAVSNRFEDTIAIFRIVRSINATTILFSSIFSSLGQTPRDIEFSKSGQWLLIANQDSSDIQLKKFNCCSGLPMYETGTPLKIGTPTCVVQID